MALNPLSLRRFRGSPRRVGLIRGRTSARGFTLIELLVVCAIVVVISAVILVDNNKFGGEVILENLAYDVALSLRQTQVYGIAVERFGQNTFSAGYGMRFSVSSPTTYVLFADTENTGIYDSKASPSEVVQTTNVQQGYAVSSLCTISAVNGGACNQVSEIDIMFKRPEPNAFISAGGNGSGGSYTVSSCTQNLITCQYEAQITLLSPRGSTSTVVVDATGQISVQ